MKKIVTRLFALILCTILLFNTGTESLAATKTVALNKKKVTLYVGTSKTLKVKGTSKTVKWSTSKKSIATVSSKGKIKAKKAGITTITAKVAGKKYSCKVTVKNPYLNKKKLSLKEGGSYRLKITGTTAKSWSSNNKKVAIVSSKGKVTAKKAGSATISCNGKNGKKYTCKVVVTSTPRPTVTVLPKPTVTITPEATVTVKPTVTVAPTTAPPVTPDRPTVVPTSGAPTIVTPTSMPTVTVHVHNYEEMITKEATCTEEGVKIYTCKNCGEKYEETIPPKGHDYETVQIVNSTCKEKGYKIKKCSHCEKVIYDEYTDLVPHEYEEKITKEPTCTKVGVKTYTCKNCGEKYEEAIPPKGHDYAETITKESTCTEEGKKSGICKVCGESYEVAVAAQGHDYEIVKVVEPTCKEKGYTIKKCSRCGNVIYDNYTDTIPHKYEEKIIKEPTCTEYGTKICTCKMCGENYEETLAAKGHDYEIIKVEEPTCTQQGYTIKKCSTCQYEIVTDQTEIIPHDYGEGEITKEAGCETEGIRTYTCNMCGITKKEIIDAIGHSYVDTKVEVTATTSGGVKHTCLKCQKTYMDEIIEALELENWKYTVDEEDKTIILTSYLSENDEVVIYPKYEVSGESYSTVFDCSFKGNEKIKSVNFAGGLIKIILFYGCTNLKEVTFGDINTSNLKNLENAFCGCTNLTSIDIGKFDISGVTSARGMFQECTQLKTIKGIENLSLENLNATSYMFKNCSSLEEISFGESANQINNDGVASVSNMFEGCINLKYADISYLTGSDTRYLEYTFKGCKKLESVKVHQAWIYKYKNFNSNMYYTTMFDESGYTLEKLLKENN